MNISKRITHCEPGSFSPRRSILMKLKTFFCIFLVALTACSLSADQKVAEQAVEKFHEMFVAGKFQELYEQSGDGLKKGGTQQDFVNLLNMVNLKLGPFKSSVIEEETNKHGLAENTVSLSYSTTFSKGVATESFVYRLEGERAILVGYHINSDALVAQ